MIRLGHLLEASTGDIHLAAALFLDDYVASTALTESIKTSSSHPLPLKLPKDESNHANAKKYDLDLGTDDDGDKVHDYKKGYSDEEEEEEWSHPSRHSRQDGRRNVNDFQVANGQRFRTRRLELPNALQDPVERSIQNGLPRLPPPPAPAPPQGGDDAEGNEEVQIRPQENLNNHPGGVRVSVSDDEITFDSIDLSSFRRKWLGKIRNCSSKHEKTDGPHANHTLKTFKRKSSVSSSDFYPDEKKQKQHDASSGNKTMHRSQGSSSSLDNEEEEDDSFYSCDSTHRFGKGHEDSNKETDFADDDDNYTDKAVYKGGNNDTKRAVLGDPDTYDNWCKYEDLFERNHDLEPSLLLWGPPSQGKDPESDPAVGEDIQVPGRQQGQGRPAVEPAMNNNNNPAANVNPVENNDPNIASASTQEEKKWPIIPWTWSGCGFQLSSCGTGLILPQPDTDTLQKLNKVHAAHRRLVSSLLPGKVPPVPVAYCGGVTALVSLVTALLYSGVSIVGHEVNCNRDRKPFADLSLEERKLEFPRRLADALSAILFIAAKQSSEKRKSSITLLESELNKERKERSKETTNGIATSDLDPDDSLDPSRDDCESMIKQDLHRQCRLVPVCRWEVEENKMKKPPRLTISLSNIEDLRLYVLSNISQYMSPGGCTLLLESLVHIYGRSRLARTLKKQRRKSGKKSYIRSLISCNCVEGQFHDWQQQELIIKEKPIISKSQDSSKSIQPQGHKCLSIELLSIILTGQVNTDISSWLTKFGIGLLCAETVEGTALSQAMKNPSNPIWLVRGISSYSVLWHKESTTKGVDLLQPFSLVHWSTWYTGRNKSTLKVIPSYCNTVVNPREEDERYFPDVECTVTSHPDDETLHPGKFQRWRFNLEPMHKEYLENGNDAKEDTCAIWIPYYRLSTTQKGIVDRKMSPHITLAIWSRWNSARVDEIHHDN